MLKLLLPLIFILILGIGGFYLYQSYVSKPAPLKTTSETASLPAASPVGSPVVSSDPCEVLTKGSDDVPPLYREGISWEEPRIDKHEILDYENDEPLRLNRQGCILISTAINKELADNIYNYYYGEFTKNKWGLIIDADGPNGSQSEFKKEKDISTSISVSALTTYT